MSPPPLTMLAVHAHPDDEAFSTGGVLARAASEGLRTIVVCGTRGECGMAPDPGQDAEAAAARLARIREEELRRACAVLGVTDVYILGYRDSGMAGMPDNADPRSFARADPEEVAACLTRLMRHVRPHIVMTYDERGGYGHPDHIAAHRATLAAVEAAADPQRFPGAGLPAWQVTKLYYTVRSRGEIARLHHVLRQHGLEIPDRPGFTIANAVPDRRVTTRVDVRAYLARKREALRMHRTQLDPANVLLTMSEDRAQEGWGSESFVRVFSHVPVRAQEEDLCEGLR